MPQQTAPDTLPANYFSDATAPATLPANYFSQPNAPTTLPANFFAQSPATPAHDPNDRFFSGGQGELRAYQPSVWDRIKQAVTAGIPNYSSRTVYNPKYGETQLLSPEEALTPSEQRAHPIATGIGEVAGGLTSPQSIALIAGTGGLGELPGAAAMLPRLISAGFGAQSIYQAARTYPEIRDAIARGDVSETERLLTHAVLNLSMAALATQHAATGRGAVSGKAQTTAEPQPVLSSPASPLSEVLHEPVPEVRVASSSAAAHEIEAKATPIYEMTPQELEAAEKLDKSRDAGLVRELFGEAAKRYNALQRKANSMTASLKEVEAASDEIAEMESRLTAAQRNRLYGIGEKYTHEDYAEYRRALGRIDDENPTALGNSLKWAITRMGNVRDPAEMTPEQQIAYAQLRHGFEIAEANGWDKNEVLKAALQGSASRFSDPEDAAMLLRQFIRTPDTEASVRASQGTLPLRAKIVSDEHVPVVSQNDVLAAAVQRIINNSDELQKAGIDPAQIQSPADALAMLNQAADHISRNIDPRASATISFEMQRQLAHELGMSVEDLLTRKSGEAFNAEHSIAARALLNDSGLNVVRSAQNAVADPSAMPEMTRALAQHQAILDAVKGMTAEAGRALGSFNVKNLPASRIADAMSKLDPDAAAEAAKLLAKIDPSNPAHLNDFVEKITPSSTADKVFEAYRNSLLSGPATVIKKGASELTMLTLETAKKLAAAGISKLKGGDEQRFASEAYWFAKGAIDGLSHIRPALTGELDLADAPGFERTGQQAIKGTVGDIVRLPSSILSKQTNAMYVLSYFGELNAQAARVAISEGLSGPELAARQEYLVEHPTSQMTKAANDTALHNTFQRDLGAFGKKVQGAIQTDPTGLLRYLVPFVRTPINIAKEGAYYSPYGLLKGTLKGDVDMQARGAVGSALAAGIAYLALNNYITGGGPVDPHKRETLEATGWMPYSVKIGDRYVSYRRLEPTGLSFALVADAVHGMSHGDAEVVSQSKADTAIAHVARSLQDASFVPTLTALTEAITNPGSRAQNFISREVGSLVPALVKDVAQAQDRTVRRPTGIAQTLESRIPGLTQNVPAVIDVTGKPVQRPVSALGGANPFVVSKRTGDPVLDTLAALGIATPQPPTKIKLRGRDVALTPQEQEQFLRQENAAFYDRAKRLMQSSAWPHRSDDAKRHALVRIHQIIADARPGRLARMRRSNTELAKK